MTRIEHEGLPVVIHFEEQELAILLGALHRLHNIVSDADPAVSDEVSFGEHADSFAAWESELAGVKQPPALPPYVRLLFPLMYPSDPAKQNDIADQHQTEQTATILAAAGRLMLDAEEAFQGDYRVELDRESAEVWLRALNHLRLAAGPLLGIESDGVALEEDEAEFLTEVYEWLGFLQEAILTVLLESWE